MAVQASRFSLASGVFGAAMIAALHVSSACSSSSDASPQPVSDATVIDEDGNPITDPDATAADGATPDSAPASLVNVTNATLQVAGDTRSYVLSVPKTFDASRKYPLIVALHGDGQTADGFRQFLGFDEITGNDAITLYPDQVVDLLTPYADNGDQQLVEAAINDVKSKYNNIDASKIWGFGYSKGGYMLNQLGCVHPGLFSAFAAHATGGPEPACPGTAGVNILESEGDADETNPGATFAAETWAQQNGCAMTRTTITPNTCSKYDNCPAGKQVEYCLAPGVTHFPIWTQATTVSWAFFKSL